MIPADTLTRLARAIRETDADAAHAELGPLWASGPDREGARQLLALMDAQDDNYDTMYGIIHVVERADPLDVYHALVAELPRLAAAAPEWAELLVARQLAADGSQGRGFDAREFLRVVQGEGDPTARESFQRIVAELERRGRIDYSRLPKPLLP